MFDDGGESKVGVLSCVWATKRAPSSEVLVAPIALVGNLGMWEIGFLHPWFNSTAQCVYVFLVSDLVSTTGLSEFN